MTDIVEVQGRSSLPGPVARRWRLGIRHPILAYVLRRVLAGIATLVVATMLIFAAIQILPGDVVQVILGRDATAQRIHALQQQLNLNENILTRYVSYVGNLVRGHLGVSTAALVQGAKVPVSGIVGPALWHSLLLAGIVIALFIPISIALAYVTARRVGRPVDHVVSATTLSVSALPEFLVGAVLIFVFFTKLAILPPISSDPVGKPDSIVLPALTLLLVSLAFGVRLLRASLIQVMAQEYVRVAQINGCSQRRIVFRYLLPNALVPSIQILAQQLQYLLGGIVIVESVFNYPGIGAELVSAISLRDIQLTMVIATILAAAYITINIAADVACVLLEPKARTTL